VEGKVRRHGGVGRQEGEGSRRREPQAEELLAETMLDVAMLKDLNSKKMVTPEPSVNAN